MEGARSPLCGSTPRPEDSSTGGGVAVLYSTGGPRDQTQKGSALDPDRKDRVLVDPSGDIAFQCLGVQARTGTEITNEDSRQQRPRQCFGGGASSTKNGVYIPPHRSLDIALHSRLFTFWLDIYFIFPKKCYIRN